MILTGTDPTQSLNVDSKKQILLPHQLLTSVIIRIAELRLITPLKEVSLAIVPTGLVIDLDNLTLTPDPTATNIYRLTIDVASGKKGIWDFTDVKPNTEAFTVLLSGSWKPEESAAATTIRKEVLMLQNQFDVTSFKWLSVTTPVTMPA